MGININVDGGRFFASDELETLAPTNPFAVFIMAQLEAKRHPNKATRLGPKIRMMRKLTEYGYDQEEIRRLFRLVDWMIRLPEDLEDEFEQVLETFSQEQKMTYITSVERWGIKKGLAQGRTEGLSEGVQEGQAELLLRLIQRRFGTTSAKTTERIQSATEPQLELWALNILDAKTLNDVFRP